MSIDVQLPAPVEGHARWCSGGCVRWASGAPTCLPYPCQCATTKENAPDWRKQLGQVQCWWKKRTGGVDSRCPCWGGLRDGKPGDCCSHHSANPRYLLDADGMLAEPDAAMAALDEAPDRDDRPDGIDAIAWDEPAWEDERPQRKPYVRRWPPEDLMCRCTVLPKGVHCPSCCRTFGTEMAFTMHRAGDACRAPADVVDVDTGAALLERDAAGVWRMHWHTHPGCCETWTALSRV